ncbi:hypothetical protein [Halosimplex amylolyticum]|uniref:hypothetical protein n=1 Tax=Halosimplex amylolyticum TaxID=3396616 RepID=UPI003F55C087
MRNASLSVADRVVAVGLAVLVVGVYLHWGQKLVGTLGLRVPWDANGFYPARAVVLLAPAVYVFVRAGRSRPRVEVAILSFAAVACVVYPPVRLLQAPGGYAPDVGFFLTTLSGLLFAVAATARYAATAGLGDGDAPAEANV